MILKSLKIFYSFFLFSTCFLFIFWSGSTSVFAQDQYTKSTSDSITKARQEQVEKMKAERLRITDSTNAARIRVADSTKRHNDSVKVVQLRILDSTRAARQVRLDSLARVRAYRNSQHYKDSVELAKQQRLDSMKNARMVYNDSVKAVQKKSLDSTIAERKRVNDSAKAAQKLFMDSTIAERTRVMDSMKVEMDRQKAERQRIIDSTTAARKIITDSLTKVREERKLAKEENVKKKEKKKQLALQLTIDKERAAYTNESMRKKGWGLVRRFKQNTTTRYNYVYNANLKMNQALTNINRNVKDSFNHPIRLFAFNPATDSARYKGDMDTIIKKAAVGIQIHDPRAKWQDDLYLLVGQAYYYKGDYENASAAFKYIISENQKNIKEQLKKERAKQSGGKKEPTKPKMFATVEQKGLKGALAHKAANNEAMMWLARTFVAEGEPQMAQMMLDLLRNDVNFPEQLEGRLALEQANIDMVTNNWNGAAEALTKVMNDSDINKNTRIRASFLNGQILQQLGQFDKSSEAYAKALGMHPNLDMSFNAQMAIAMNSLKDSSTKDDVNSVLEKMTKDEKYATYFDQIYYVLGNNALESLDTALAKEYLEKSIAKNTNNIKQRGLTFSTIGDMRYQQQEYIAAINAYDSASIYLTKEDQPAFNNAIIRARMLDKVVEPALAVRTNDSLLRLAALSEPDQRAFIKNYISDLEKSRIDSFYKAQNAAAVNSANANAAVSTGNNTWYFGNTSNVQKGAQEFTKKWGNITLKDNWRRSNNMSMDAGSGGAVAEMEKRSPEEEIRANLPNADSLYALIPKTTTEKQMLKDILESNLYELGKAYFYDLEDAPRAMQAFDTLDAQFRNNRYLPETIYLRYLNALRTGEKQFADEYYKTLKTVYADDKWAMMLDAAPTEEDNSQKEMLALHYQQTYQQLLDGQYQIALKAANDVAFSHPVLGNYTQKYELIKVMSYAGLQDFKKADTLIKGFLTRFSNDSLADWGRQVLNYIQKNINNSVSSENIIPTQQTVIGASNNGTESSTSAVANTNAYTKDGARKYYILVKLPNDGRMQNVRTEWQNLNNANYAQERYKLSSVEMGKEAVLYVREFETEADARKYLNVVGAQEFISRDYSTNDVNLMFISDKNFGTLLVERKIADYIAFFTQSY